MVNSGMNAIETVIALDFMWSFVYPIDIESLYCFQEISLRITVNIDISTVTP